MDSHLHYVPKTIIDFLGVLSGIDDISERSSKLDDFVKMLEEEKRKINAFKRELPFCMRLMDDAIRILKDAEETHCRRLDLQPVEFIPLKENDSMIHGEDEEPIGLTKDIIDKRTWLSSAQLWKTDEFDHNRKQNSGHGEEKVQSLTEDSFNSTKTKKSFMPFPLVVHPSVKGCKDQSNLQTTIRKQRRCWSPELHRRFIDALQKLGGPHAATPRQIRELMQIDSLTNDEVKSHLQKYRLHSAKKAHQNSESWKQSSGSQSGSPQGPFDSAVGTSAEEEEERSESCGCKNQIFRSGQSHHIVEHAMQGVEIRKFCR